MFVSMSCRCSTTFSCKETKQDGGTAGETTAPGQAACMKMQYSWRCDSFSLLHIEVEQAKTGYLFIRLTTIIYR